MSNIKKKIISLIFVLSLPFFSLFVCGNYDLKYIKYLILLSFLCAIFIKIKILKNKIFDEINYKYLFFSVIFSLYAGNLISNYSGFGVLYIYNIFNDILEISLSFEIVKLLVGFLAMPAFIVLTYYVTGIIFSFIKDEYNSLSKVEKRFIIIFVSVGFLLISVVYTLTNVFYLPIFNGSIVNYDVVYTSDSGVLSSRNAYLNIGMEENDIRQPLFGLFSLPFSVISYFLSEFLFFIPNSQIVIFNTIQNLLIALSVVMLGRLLKLKEEKKILFQIFFASTFSVLLFSFLLEQYVIVFFYLILTIYLTEFKKLDVNYFYVTAVGTLLTSGIIFPLISKFKNFKYWFINIFKCFIFFVVSMILSGQFLQVFTLIDNFEFLMNFSGKSLLFIDKLKQFLYFVKSIFIAPNGNIVFSENIPRYFLQEVNFICILGIIILGVCFISFILNRKNRMAVISFLWIIFSFLILCMFGWGTKENGLILYSLYFSWAYVILIYLFIEKIFKNNRIKYFIIGGLCFVLYFINIYELYNIVMFGIKYY